MYLLFHLIKSYIQPFKSLQGGDRLLSLTSTHQWGFLSPGTGLALDMAFWKGNELNFRNAPVLEAVTAFQRGWIYCSPLWLHQNTPQVWTPSHSLTHLVIASAFVAAHCRTAVWSQHISLCTRVDSSPKLWQILDKRTIWNAFPSLCLVTARDKCVWMMFIHSWEQ